MIGYRQKNLDLNLSKTVQDNIKTSASTNILILKNDVLNGELEIKYQRILLDAKLSFQSQIEIITIKFGKQCGIVTKHRHYASRRLLTEHYKSNIAPILQNGISVHDCCSITSLYSILTLQK